MLVSRVVRKKEFLVLPGNVWHQLGEPTGTLELPTSPAKFFSQAQSASGRFVMFYAAKASERARACLASPAKTRIK